MIKPNSGQSFFAKIFGEMSAMANVRVEAMEHENNSD
jgi:hypothetical protein